MAYTPNKWVDREGVTRYFESVDDDGALILTPDYTQVTEMGTPVNSDNMNHIEEGIAAGSFTKYDPNTTYAKDDLVTAIVDGELKVYKSLQDNNNGQDLTQTAFWVGVELGGAGSGYAMPSNKYIDLTVGASGTTYTAPANGWYWIAMQPNNGNSFCGLYHKDGSKLSSVSISTTNYASHEIYIPVKSGDIILLQYENINYTNYFRFIYAEGEV